jgi:hypothetical protein
MGRDGLGDLDAVIVGALDDGGGRVLLRTIAEQQNRGVSKAVLVGQLEMRQCIALRRGRGQVQVTLPPGDRQEPLDLGVGDVVRSAPRHGRRERLD